MSDKSPWPRLAASRHFEFDQEPSPEFRAKLKHLWGRHSRAKGAERQEIDMRIEVLVAKEQARQAENTAPQAGAVDAEEESDDGYGDSGLTREDIVAAKRAHDAEGHNSLATHRRLNVSARSLNRARHHHGLVPWPKD